MTMLILVTGNDHKFSGGKRHSSRTWSYTS